MSRWLRQPNEGNFNPQNMASFSNGQFVGDKARDLGCKLMADLIGSTFLIWSVIRVRFNWISWVRIKME